MAESSAAFILSKIDNFVSNKLSLRGSNEEGIKLLRNDHENITVALEGVDAHMEQDGQNRVRIQQLRRIKYEIENVLDMYEYRKAEEKTKHVFNRGAIWKDHPIAKEIQKIQTELKNFKENMGAYRLESHPVPASTSTDHGPGIAPSRIPESDIVGVEGPRKDLASWVLDVDRAYGVMFVVGMGGSGKTALVKVVYEQLKTDFDCHVWLTASKFEKTEELLSWWYSELCNQTGQSSSTSSSHDFSDMLRNYLRDKRYLIVVDNWNRKDWESVKSAFPEDNISRVIITTRRGDIASSCRDTSVDIYKIPPLPREKARELFCRKAFPGSRVYPSVQGVAEASERLLKECEGLPLGIIEMGKLLSRKSISKSRIEDLENKLRAELKLNSSNSGNSGQLSRITQVLLSSYNELPYNLKRCFLYMTMFPKEHPVKRGMLIRLWMAEDFITREVGKEPEDIGEEYLEELTGRNLIQDELGFDGKPRAYRVHNLMHKIALSLAESFCTIGVDIPENPRRLSVQNSELNELNRLNKDLHHLSTFFVSSLCTNSPEDKKKIPPIPRGIIPSMRHLKILHLDNTKVDALPKGMKELFLLKYLSLCDTDIKQIPISTERLNLLETLNLKQTFVTVLPDSLATLEKLRYLAVCRIDHRDPFDAVRGFKAPTGIRNLTNLQKLSYVIADRDHKLIKELQNLTKLRKLGIVDLPGDSGPLLCKTIQKLTSLRSLSVQAPETLNQLPEIQDISNPPPLQRLYLWGRLQKMPGWISNLHELVRIRLKWSRLDDNNNPVTILGELPSLLELQLLDAYTGNQLDFHPGTFPKLKILEFNQMEQLQIVIIDNRSLPCLQKLTISLCKNLREIPAGIDRVTQLKDLHLRGMPPEFVNPLKGNGTLHHLVRRVKINSMQLQNGVWVQQDMS
ncbi:hypothetical protein C2S52_022937 [Perilla frutescens var. hirtella]|nr:hypothetical protein C2S52_022937 [Perilla frutescens var. hirtella]